MILQHFSCHPLVTLRTKNTHENKIWSNEKVANFSHTIWDTIGIAHV